MTLILFTVMLVFAGFSGYRAVKASRKTETLSDFYSFGPEVDPSVVRRAFQATNISFTTSFVALYLFGFAQGWFTFATPICFCLGIVVYAKCFLPRQINALASGKKYPELLAHAIGRPHVRRLVALYVIFSLWMFTFAEVQGLHLFLSKLFKDVSILVQAVPIVIVCSIAFYVSRNGYRATTSNDKMQMRFVFLGALAVLALTVILISQSGVSKVLSAVSSVGNPFVSIKGAAMFLSETFLGFVFSQLLYYDNWQRLGFWVRARITQDGCNAAPAEQRRKELDQLVAIISKEYMWGTVPMFLVFCAPIALAFASLAGGATAGDMDHLSNFLRNSWTSMPVAGPLLVVLAFVFMLSALISTAESYVIAISNCLVEDVAQIDIASIDATNQKKYLEAARMLTAVIAVSFVPFLLLRPQFDTFFIYLFYSANGFVGPLICVTLERKFRLWGLLCSASFGFVYPAIPILLPSLASYAPYPGIVTVVVSVALVLLSGRKG